jgi:hypothetical protein
MSRNCRSKCDCSSTLAESAFAVLTFYRLLYGGLLGLPKPPIPQIPVSFQID